MRIFFSMSAGRLTGIILILGITSSAIGVSAHSAFAAPSRESKEYERTRGLERAVTQYEETLEEARSDLLEAFDLVLEQLPKLQIDPDKRVKYVNLISVEQTRFRTSGAIPWSRPMWSYMCKYKITVEQAEAKLNQSYDAEMHKALKSKETVLLYTLRDDLKSVLKTKVLAVWQHGAGGGRTKKISLYSNGRISSEEGEAGWAVLPNGKLVLNWPNLEAPRNRRSGVRQWRDNCEVSEEGDEYRGKNQHGVTIRGVYRPN